MCGEFPSRFGRVAQGFGFVCACFVFLMLIHWKGNLSTERTGIEISLGIYKGKKKS